MADVMQKQGTTIVLTSSGGDVVIDLASLANAACRQSGEFDLGAVFPQFVRVELTVDFNAAPTAGLPVNVYWSSSEDGTNYDGECTGSDAAFALADCTRLRFVGSLIASNNTDPQRASFTFAVPSRYGVLVVHNASGQALTATGTDQVLKITPLKGDVS